MKLTFDAKIVKELIAHAKAATDHQLCYGQDKKEPGLIFVGDDGVYLMSNGLPHQPAPDNPKGRLVAYANECNPKKMPFDAWWAAKRASWGGDDGAEFIPLEQLPEHGEIIIDITPDVFAVIELVPN